MQTDEEKEAYLKWYHNIFYPRICAQIKECETILETYQQFKSSVEGLKANLEECSMLIKSTYGYAKSGISCSDFNANIDKISTHGDTMQKHVQAVEGVIGMINTKINKINQEIASLRSQIRF